ncbi:MAG: hypothetical protein U9R08_06375 [Nanoarchaeota archaeon]|nr:hypothetical protein [Nanoarchaeota archaeon]
MLKGAEKFFKVYSGLPIKERENTIVVIDDEPINWKLAHEEVSNETEIGKKVLKILIKLEII